MTALEKLEQDIKLLKKLRSRLFDSIMSTDESPEAYADITEAQEHLNTASRKIQDAIGKLKVEEAGK